MPNGSDMINQQIIGSLEESAGVKKELADKKAGEIKAIAELLVSAYRNGGKLIICGNGGSAADAQHIAAELVGKFLLKRQALAAIALTTNSSIVTAIANDFSYDLVFSRQVEALVSDRDVVIGISTSGNATNVIKAIDAARRIGAKTVGLTGSTGGGLAIVADVTLSVPSDSTPRIQEAHITIGHIICEIVEKELAREA